MDLGTLPDVLPYVFSIAANFSHTFPHQAAEVGQDIWVAVHEHDAMPEGQRNFQLLKLAGSSVGLGISIAAISVEGIAGFAIGECEALMELEKAGHQWRCTHNLTPPPQPLW